MACNCRPGGHSHSQGHTQSGRAGAEEKPFPGRPPSYRRLGPARTRTFLSVPPPHMLAGCFCYLGGLNHSDSFQRSVSRGSRSEVKQSLGESPGRSLPSHASSMGCGGPRAAEEVKCLDLLDEASDEALVIFQPSLPVSAPQQPPVTLFQKLYLPSLRELSVDLPGENGCSGNLPFLRNYK